MKYVGFLALITFLASCNKPTVEKIVVYDTTAYEIVYHNNTLPPTTFPLDNKLTKEKVYLGRVLFFDKKLSRDGTVNCASCHLQENAFSDPKTFSEGVDGNLGKRQAMAIFNMAWHQNGFFWDGRAELLRHQSILPIQDPLEMDQHLDVLMFRLSQNQDYKDQFFRAFGSETVTTDRIAAALEAFMMTIISDDSKYDRFLAGKETLTDSEERGRQLFFGEYNEFFPDVSGADCAHCHAGNNFENDLYMNNGLDSDAEFDDLGRYEVTGDDMDKARFKVPSLRNVAVTAPYMHDGRFATLEEVVDHYNEHVKNSSTVDPALLGTTSTGLMLDETEKQDLINFLHTLTDYTYLNNMEYSTPFR